MPYKIGIATAVTAGFLSFPMIFDIHTVEWFNSVYVTSDVPEPKDLETPLEVSNICTVYQLRCTYVHLFIILNAIYFPLIGWQLGLELDGTSSVSLRQH